MTSSDFFGTFHARLHSVQVESWYSSPMSRDVYDSSTSSSSSTILHLINLSLSFISFCLISFFVSTNLLKASLSTEKSFSSCFVTVFSLLLSSNSFSIFSHSTSSIHDEEDSITDVLSSFFSFFFSGDFSSFFSSLFSC